MEMQPDPGPLMAAFRQLLLAECAAAAAADGVPEGDHEAARIRLPPECHCLWSVYQWGLARVGSNGGDLPTGGPPAAGGTGAQRKRSRSSSRAVPEPHPAGTGGPDGVTSRLLPMEASFTEDAPLPGSLASDMSGGLSSVSEALIDGLRCLGPALKVKKAGSKRKGNTVGEDPAVVSDASWGELLSRFVTAITTSPKESLLEPGTSSLCRAAMETIASSPGGAAASSEEEEARLLLPRHRALRTLACLLRCIVSHGLGLADLLANQKAAATSTCCLALMAEGRQHPGAYVAPGLLAHQLLHCTTHGPAAPSPALRAAVTDLLFPSLQSAEAAVLAACASHWSFPAATLGLKGASVQKGQDDVQQWQGEVLRNLLLPPGDGTLSGEKEGRLINLTAVNAVMGPHSLLASRLCGGRAEQPPAPHLAEMLLPVLASALATSKGAHSALCSCTVHGSGVAASLAAANNDLLNGASASSQPPVSPSTCPECTAARGQVLRLCAPLIQAVIQPLLVSLSNGTSSADCVQPVLGLLPYAEPLQLQQLCDAVLDSARRSLGSSGGRESGQGPKSAKKPRDSNHPSPAAAAAAAAVGVQSPTVPSASQLDTAATALLVAAVALPGQTSGAVLLSAQALLSPLLPHLGSSQRLVEARDTLLASALQWDAHQRLRRPLEEEKVAKEAEPVLDSRLWLQSVMAHPTASSAASASKMMHVGRLACRMLLEALAAGGGGGGSGEPQATEDGGGGGALASEAARRRRSLALLLPVADALMHQPPGAGGGRQQLAALAALYRGPLTAYVMKRRRKGEAEGGGEGQAAAADLEVVEALTGHAVSVLLACLEHGVAPTVAERAQLIAKLLPQGKEP